MQMAEFQRTKYLKIMVAGYTLWFLQNLLILMAAVIFCYHYNDVIPGRLAPSVQLLLHVSSNSLMFLALLLDLVTVSLLAYSGFFLHRASTPRFARILFVSGLLWLVVSLFWRTPFYLQGPLDFGFAMGPFLNEVWPQYGMRDVFNNHFMMNSLFFSSLFLAVFFTCLHRSASTRGIRMYLNLGMTYGMINLSAICAFFLIYLLRGVHSSEFFIFALFILSFVLKLFLTPVAGLLHAGRSLQQLRGVLSLQSLK